MQTPAEMQRLTLSEALCLIALDDARGTVGMDVSSHLQYALAGAAILDLTLRARLAVAGKDLAVTDAAPTGDDILDDALAAIVRSEKRRSVAHWVRNLGKGVPHHRERVIARLVARGILRREDDRLLWVFSRQRFPTSDPAPEHDLRDHLRAVALGTAAPDLWSALLLNLLNAGRMEGLLLSTREERRVAKPQLEAFARGEVVGTAVAEAITAVQAAVMAATTAAVVAASAGGATHSPSC